MNSQTSIIGKALLCGLVSAFALASGEAQTNNYSTNFNTGYTTGNLAGQNGWTAISGAGTNPIQVNATTGVATVQAIAGEDDSVNFTTNAVGTGMMGTVTAAFGNLNVTSASAAGSYSLALSGANASTNYTGRVYAKSSGTGYLLGITTAGAATTVVYGTTVEPFGTTINLTINYGFGAGTGDDTLSIAVNGATYATYGTAFDFGGTGNGSATLGSALLRQDAANTTAFTVGSINVTSNLTAAAAPEPGTWSMITLGSLGAFFAIRRRSVRA